MQLRSLPLSPSLKKQTNKQTNKKHYNLSQKAFLKFPKMELFIFSRKSFSYVSENGSF